MRTLQLTVFVLLAALVFSGCNKDDDEHTGPAPKIEFVSISPNPYTEYSGPVAIKITYRDNDADLGENNPDAKNLFVTDSRNGVTYKYRIQELAPPSANIIIAGELDIFINSVGIIDPAATSETVSYSIYCVDRAGNQSNTIETSVLTVNE